MHRDGAADPDVSSGIACFGDGRRGHGLVARAGGRHNTDGRGANGRVLNDGSVGMRGHGHCDAYTQTEVLPPGSGAVLPNGKAGGDFDRHIFSREIRRIDKGAVALLCGFRRNDLAAGCHRHHDGAVRGTVTRLGRQGNDERLSAVHSAGRCGCRAAVTGFHRNGRSFLRQRHRQREGALRFGNCRGQGNLPAIGGIHGSGYAALLISRGIPEHYRDTGNLDSRRIARIRNTQRYDIAGIGFPLAGRDIGLIVHRPAGAAGQRSGTDFDCVSFFRKHGVHRNGRISLHIRKGKHIISFGIGRHHRLCDSRLAGLGISIAHFGGLIAGIRGHGQGDLIPRLHRTCGRSHSAVCNGIGNLQRPGIGRKCSTDGNDGTALCIIRQREEVISGIGIAGQFHGRLGTVRFRIGISNRSVSQLITRLGIHRKRIGAAAGGLIV